MTDSRKLILGAVALLAAAAAFWYLALAPKQEQVSTLKGQIDTVRGEIAATQAQVATLRKAEDGYALNYASVARLGKAVPADDDMRSLIVQLDSAAKRSGVGFSSIELTAGSAAAPAATGPASQAATATLPPGAAVGPAGLPTMPFSFQFDGSFFSLSDFFARLDRFVKAKDDRVDVTGRLLAIDGFSLEPGEEGFPSVIASIGATAYLVPEDQGAMGGGTPTGPTASGSGGAATPAATAPAATPAPTALTTIGDSR